MAEVGAEVFRQGLVNPADHIIVAYDGMPWHDIRVTGHEVGEFTGMGKTNSAHVRRGVDRVVTILDGFDQESMLDSKFHDIPETVALSVQAATEAGGSLITVHASGGFNMLEAAVRGAAIGRSNLEEDIREGRRTPVDISRVGHVLGITVLTSLQDEAYSIFGLDPEDTGAITKKVLEFTHMASDAGLTGVVCSPLEARAVREDPDLNHMLVVTPAITPRFAKKAGDQKRTTNAVEAIGDGADLIVVGRGINKAADYNLSKARASQLVGDEVGEGLERRRAA